MLTFFFSWKTLNHSFSIFKKILRLTIIKVGNNVGYILLLESDNIQLLYFAFMFVALLKISLNRMMTFLRHHRLKKKNCSNKI